MEYKYEQVLIIDDSEMDLLVNQMILSSYKFAKNIIAHSSAREALTYLKNRQEDNSNFPDYIFLDLNMPVMNGFEFLKAFEDLSSNLSNNTRVIVITSSDDDSDIQKAGRFKCVKGYLVKPLDFDELKKI